ncbi:MAG: gliding motility protein GldL [Prevotellaceae bacterium]|jgi:gliding motility-associated protein GldL|nr:gliding motility protein GldL [Prevotellaceae bacterium]
MNFLESPVMKRIIAVAYGMGASVVILGALFKLMHWPGAGTMLIAGMSVEAGIFFISVFEALPKEYHWDAVFPELTGEHVSESQEISHTQRSQTRGGNVNFDLSIDETTTNELKDNIRKFSDSINQISDLSRLVSATSNLAMTMNSASNSIVEVGESAGNLSDSYSRGSQVIQQLNEQSKIGLEQIHSGYEYYRGQLETLGCTMGALNSSYELYLQETKKVQTDYISLHGEIQQLASNINISISETQKLGAQMVSLNNNVENLNSIYGSMLTAVNSVLNK